MEGVYMNTYKLVEEVINEWDPINLLPLAPRDEYKLEILKIVNLLQEINSTQELGRGIYQIFVRCFDDMFKRSEKDCLLIAERIIAKLHT